MQLDGPEGSTSFYDEEDLLPFKVFLAELELLVGSCKGKRKPDAAQALRLLQKLVGTLDRTDRAEIKEYQRRCEDSLIDILLKGAAPPVRRLICDLLGKLYSRGDQLPLYSRVSSLQLFLGTAEAFSKVGNPDVRLGALELVAALYYSQGRSLSIGVYETTSMAAKHAIRGTDLRTRCAALRLLAAATEGVGGSHRGAAQVQHEALRVVEKLVKDKVLAEPVKLACANVIRAIAVAGGAHLWSSNLYPYEAAKTICLHGLSDPSQTVRSEYAKALGEIAVASLSPTAKESIPSAGAKPRHQQAQEKALSAIPLQCLVTPFAEAAAGSNRPMCSALSEAWVRYLTGARAKCGQDEALFMEPAMSLIEALKAACLESGSTPERGLVGLDELGIGASSGERPHAQACVLYALRTGVIEQLAEGGQKLFLERITALLAVEVESCQPAVAVVALEAAALLTEALGEIGSEAAAALEPAVTGKLSAPQQAVRLQAASTLAALAVTEQANAARLLKTAIAGVGSARQSLTSAAETHATQKLRPPPIPSTPRGLGSAKFKPEIDAVHGWAAAVAALLGASARLDLGLPSSCITSVVELAGELIMSPSSQGAVPQAVEREAGYIMLGALCQVAYTELNWSIIPLNVLDFWTPALSDDAGKALAELYASNTSYLDHSVAAELWWRCAALHSLTAFITAATTPAKLTSTSDPAVIKQQSQQIAALLRPMLLVVQNHPALSDPARAKGGPSGPLAAAGGMFQLRLLQAYACLPSAGVYQEDHEALTKLCLKAVKGAAASGALELLTPALRHALDRRDDVLGPWNEGLNPTERALMTFSGVPGGPQVTPCTAGQRRGTGYASYNPTSSLFGSTTNDDSDGLLGMHDFLPGGGMGGIGNNTTTISIFEDEPVLFPQPLGLAAALLVLHTQVLGRVLSSLAPENQTAVMGNLVTTARGNPADVKTPESAKLCAALAAAAAALPGVNRASPQAEGAEALSAAAQALAEHLLQFTHISTAARRASADLYAAAAKLGPDSQALQLIKSLCQEAAATSSLPKRATLSLATGSVCSTVGGLGLPAVMPVAARTLLAITEASDRSIAPWTLHALLSCATAGGPAFVPYIKETLRLCEAVLLGEDIYSTPGLLPAVGRLVNGSIAVLGPEYTLGSAAYEVSREVILEMQAAAENPEGLGIDTSYAVSAALEAVLYAQMLVLFAPNALPASHHVAVLLATLPSRRPGLRKAAADTLRHLAERDPTSMLKERVEGALLQALDLETDPSTAAQLQATLWTLCSVGAAKEPSRWLGLFAAMVTAAPRSASAADLGGDGGLGGGGDEDDDDGDGFGAFSGSRNNGGSGTASARPRSASDGGGATASASVAGSSSSTGGGAFGGGSGNTDSSGALLTTPRLRTRLFAARCLLRIPRLACFADPRHVDIVSAQNERSSGDWLVFKLQWLVDVGYKITTGQMEALRPFGVELLTEVLTLFGSVPDPLVEGQALIAQYQAQLVSALRISLAVDASPALQASGATLAAAFLDSGLAMGDAAVMNRLMALLCALLDHHEALYQQSGGSSGMQRNNSLGKMLESSRGSSGGQEAGTSSGDGFAYAEWVAAKARVALLEAHAHCAVLGGQEAQRNRIERLVDAWIWLLHDYCALMLLPPEEAQHHPLSVLPQTNPATNIDTTNTSGTTTTITKTGLSSQTGGTPTAASVISHVLPSINKAWQVVLDASTLNLSAAPAVPALVDGIAGYERHAALLDVTLTALQSVIPQLSKEYTTNDSNSNTCGGNDVAEEGQGAFDSLVAVLSILLTALQRLTSTTCLENEWVSMTCVADVTTELVSIVEDGCVVKLPVEVVEKVAVILQQLATSAASITAAATTTSNQAAEEDNADEEEEERLSVETQEALLAAAERCLNLPQTNVATISAALSACAGLITTATHTTSAQHIPLLHRVITTGVGVLSNPQHTREERKAAGEVVKSTAIAALQHHHHHTRDLDTTNSTTNGQPSDLPTILEVVAGCCCSLEELIITAVDSSNAEDTASALSCLLPIIAALTQVTSTSSTSTVEAATNGVASLTLATGDGNGGTANNDGDGDDGFDDDDEWGDMEFAAAAPLPDPLEITATTNTVLDSSIQCSIAAQNGMEIGEDVVLCTAVQQSTLSVLQAAAESDDSGVGNATVHVVNVHLQEDAPESDWGGQCVAAVLPVAAQRAHVVVTQGGVLPASQVQEVAEVLRLCLLGYQLGPPIVDHVVRIAVPLLIEAAAPASAPTPSLIEASVRVLTALGSGVAAGPFRDTVAALPQDVKQRLQAALSAAVPSGGGGSGQATGVSGVVGKKPAIQLKTFAALKPPTK